jgi:hypothetical protein
MTLTARLSVQNKASGHGEEVRQHLSSFSDDF